MSKQLAIGINHTLVNNDNGVPTTFHSLGLVSHDFRNGYSRVTVLHYYNEDMFTAGKSPIHESYYDVYGVIPRNADMVEWLLKQLVKDPSEGELDSFGQPLVSHDLTGGEVKYGQVSD